MVRSTLSKSCAALALLAAGAALADDAAPAAKPNARRACRTDVQRLCADIQPGGGRIIACLKAHSADLNPDCSNALAAAEARRANAAPN